MNVSSFKWARKEGGVSEMTWSTFILVYYLLRHDLHHLLSLTDLKILYETFEEGDKVLSPSNVTRDSLF